MKKIVSLLLVTVIGVMAPAPAFAAPSPSASVALVNNTTASSVYVDGERADASVISIEDYDAPDDLVLTDIDKSLSNMILLTSFDLKVIGIKFKKLKFTVAIPALKADDKVAIAQKAGDVWKLLDDENVEVGNGKLTLTVEKTGTILVMVEK